MFTELLSSPEYLWSICAIRRLTNNETSNEPLISMQCYFLFLACASIPCLSTSLMPNKSLSQKREWYIYLYILGVI